MWQHRKSRSGRTACLAVANFYPGNGLWRLKLLAKATRRCMFGFGKAIHGCPVLLFLVTTSLVICTPAAFLRCSSRFSGSLSESNPNSLLPVIATKLALQERGLEVPWVTEYWPESRCLYIYIYRCLVLILGEHSNGTPSRTESTRHSSCRRFLTPPEARGVRKGGDWLVSLPKYAFPTKTCLRVCVTHEASMLAALALESGLGL